MHGVLKDLNATVKSLAGHDPQSYLFYPIQRGGMAITNILLRDGVKTDIRDYKGRTPLESAVDHGRLQVAHLLLQHDVIQEGQEADSEWFRKRLAAVSERITRPIGHHWIQKLETALMRTI